MRNRPADADDLLIKIVAALLLVVAGAWIYLQATSEPDASPSPAEIDQAALQASAIVRDREMALDESQRRRDEAPLQDMRSQAGASTINGKVLFNCSYRGTVTIQTVACPPPWIDVGPAGTGNDYGNQDSLQQQEWNRQQGEARLREEEAKLAAFIANERPAQTYFSSQPQSDLNQRRARCQAQKDYRDEVLRQVGLNRTYDLLRKLNDQVYEACKDT